MYLGSKNRLTARSLPLFGEQTLFDRIARAVCRAECLCRKELFESWEVARRVRRRFRGGRVVDLAAGHGLLGSILLLLDDTTPEVVGVDRRMPDSAPRLRASLEETWPRLAGRVRFHEGEIEDFEVKQDDLIVSAHACGSVTDVVLTKAIAAGARVAVLPCCHAIGKSDGGHLEGWIDGPLAIDIMRAVRLQQHGYRTYTAEIPDEITPKNRLLLGDPRSTGAHDGDAAV
jgi:hypothetical protein